jgi:hypothetical protein
MRLLSILFALCLLVNAEDRGLPPRSGTADYPVHQGTKQAQLAAAVVPDKQIAGMFSAEIARRYVVLEVGIYPRNNQMFEVAWSDFTLKIGDAFVRVEKPRDVAAPWQEKSRIPDKPVTVISEAGLVFGRSTDPVNGKRSSVGTYESVAVTNDPRAAPAPPPPSQTRDPQAVERRVLETVLPEGPTRVPVAGYLFFPTDKLKRRKGDAIELRWSKDSDSAVLKVPAK